jgi:flagellar biosynthesis protein FlhG
VLEAAASRGHLRPNQADGLSQLTPAPMRVLPITHATRGVGYTMCVANTAAGIARTGSKVVVLDAGRAFVAAALGLRAKFELLHLLTGEKTFSETVLSAADFSVLPAAKGLDEFIQSGSSVDDLYGAFTQLSSPVDLLLLAVGAHSLSALVPPSSEVLIVSSDESESVKATYGLLKRLAQDSGFHRFRILLNNVESERNAHDVYARLADTAHKFLNAELSLADIVPRDVSVKRACASSSHLFKAEVGPAQAAFSRVALDIPNWQLAEFARTFH